LYVLYLRGVTYKHALVYKAADLWFMKRPETSRMINVIDSPLHFCTVSVIVPHVYSTFNIAYMSSKVLNTYIYTYTHIHIYIHTHIHIYKYKYVRTCFKKLHYTNK